MEGIVSKHGLVRRHNAIAKEMELQLVSWGHEKGKRKEKKGTVGYAQCLQATWESSSQRSLGRYHGKGMLFVSERESKTKSCKAKGLKRKGWDCECASLQHGSKGTTVAVNHKDEENSLEATRGLIGASNA